MGYNLKTIVLERLKWGISEDRLREGMEEAQRNPAAYAPDFAAAEKFELAWSRFNYLGPINGKCDSIRSFGFGDEEKKLCWHDDMDSNKNCIVYSIGSGNIFSFEKDIIKKTKCIVHIFDCTVVNPNIPPEIASRAFFHKVCLSKFSIHSKGRLYLSYKDIVKLVGAKPTYLKMDIEGYEYEVFESLLGGGFQDLVESPDSLLPDQIAVELHYRSSFGTLSISSFFTLSQILFFKGGYILVEKNNNIMCRYCTEALFVRAICLSK